MSGKYKNVPQKYEERIDASSQYKISEVEAYRGIRHFGDLCKEDFYPTFADPHTKKNRAKIANNVGPIGPVLISYSPDNLSECSLSLFTDINDLKSVLWKTEETKKQFPVIAKGIAPDCFGDTYKFPRDRKSHINYFCFDYENNDFSGNFEVCETIKEEDSKDA